MITFKEYITVVFVSTIISTAACMLIFTCLGFQDWPEYKIQQFWWTECQDEKCGTTILVTQVLKRTEQRNHKLIMKWEDEDTSKESAKAYMKFAEEWVERHKANSVRPKVTPPARLPESEL